LQFLPLQASSYGWSFCAASRPRRAAEQCSVWTVWEPLQPATLLPVMTRGTAGRRGLQQAAAAAAGVMSPLPDAAAAVATSTCNDHQHHHQSSSVREFMFAQF